MKEETLRKIAEALKDNPRFTEKVLNIFSNCSSWEAEDYLQEMFKSHKCDVRCAAAKYESISPDLLQAHVKDSSSSVRGSIARNPNCNKETLELLLKDKVGSVRFYAACNRNCPSSIKTKMVYSILNDPKLIRRERCMIYQIRQLLKYATPGLLKKLAKRKEVYVRKIVAENAACPQELLEELINDTETSVREIAAKGIASEEILFKLVQEKNDAIDDAIALNPNTTAKVIRAMLKCGNVQVECLKNIAIHPNCDEETVRKLAKNEDVFVRQRIAKRRKLSLDILRMLANDGEFWVRERVANNENCPIDLLDKLSYDAIARVRCAVAANKETRDSTLYRMYYEDKNMAVRCSAGKNIFDVHNFDCISGSFFYVQLSAYAENPKLYEKDLLKLIEKCRYSSLENARCVYVGIASNRNATEKVIEAIVELIDDKQNTTGIYTAIAENKNFGHKILRYLFDHNMI